MVQNWKEVRHLVSKKKLLFIVVAVLPYLVFIFKNFNHFYCATIEYLKKSGFNCKCHNMFCEYRFVYDLSACFEWEDDIV